MRAFDPRAARVAWTVFLIAALLVALYLIRQTLFIFVVAIFFAYMISPVVDLVGRYAPARSRTFSLAIVYLVLLGVLVTAGTVIGSRIIEEATSLAQRLPELAKAEALPSTWHVPAWLESVRVRVLAAVREQFETGAEQAVPMFRELGQHIFAIVGNLAFAILVPILGFFFLKDGKHLLAVVLAQFSGGRRALVEATLQDMHYLLAQYIRALVVLSFATFAFYSAFYLIAGVPYAVLLGGIAALLEFIPVIGPLIGATAAVVVALASGYDHVVLMIVFFLLFRLFQDYVLQPYLMSSGVELHPLLVIFGVLAGEQVAGIPGMFLSIPVLATLRVIYLRIRRESGVEPVLADK
jgi:predicted PurR-regulated permease PerM